MGLMSNDLARLSPAAQKQVMEKMQGKKKPKKNKYRNEKTVRIMPNGEAREFHSKKEAERYDALIMLQKAGEIRGLKLQVRYWLQEDHITCEGEKDEGILYIADFTYERRTAPDNYGQRYWLPVVEDVKGMRTRDYAMKAKMFKSRYGFAIREV